MKNIKKIICILIITLLSISSSFAYNPTLKDKKMVQNLNITLQKISEKKLKDIKVRLNKAMVKFRNKNNRISYLLWEIEKSINNILEKKQEKIEKKLKSYEVKSIVDGDTIYIIKDWKALRLRMIWIDAPEKSALRYWYTEKYGKEAAEKLKELIGNNKITLEYDETQWIKDIHWRDLVYIFVWNRNINQEMIESGFAKEYTYKKPYKYQKKFRETESKAKENKLYIWENYTKETEKNIDKNTFTIWWIKYFNPYSKKYLNMGFNCEIKAPKYCTKVKSCEEATFFWKECWKTNFDRDIDQIPCENVCWEQIYK